MTCSPSINHDRSKPPTPEEAIASRIENLAANARRLAEGAALADVATHVVSRFMPEQPPEVARALGTGFGELLRQWLTPRRA